MKKLSYIWVCSAALLIGTSAQASLDPNTIIANDYWNKNVVGPQTLQYSEETRNRISQILVSICTKSNTIYDDYHIQYNPNIKDNDPYEICDFQAPEEKTIEPKITFNFWSCANTWTWLDLCRLTAKELIDHCLVYDRINNSIQVFSISCEGKYKFEMKKKMKKDRY